MRELPELARRAIVPVLLLVLGAVVAVGVQRVPAFSGSETEFVVINEDLTITVTNRSQLPFGLAFELPSTCLEVREEIEASTAGVAAADDFVRTRAVSKISLLTALGEEICSYSDWTDIQANVLSPLIAGET